MICMLKFLIYLAVFQTFKPDQHLLESPSDTSRREFMEKKFFNGSPKLL
jgi:hypothetical protein